MSCAELRAVRRSRLRSEETAAELRRVLERAREGFEGQAPKEPSKIS